jgi:hypothetical protein
LCQGGAYPILNYANDTLHCSYHDTDALSAQNDQYYVPHESDISIQNPGDAWFYHKGHAFDSSSVLWEKYLAVVGRGSHFIVNVPPNRSGLIVDEFVAAVAGMGDAVQKSFGVHAGRMARPVTAKCAQLRVVLPSVGTFDSVVLQEGLTNGQTILNYTLDLQHPDTKQWTAIRLDPKLAGVTVGTKAIVLLPGGLSNASAVRFTCTGAIASNDAAFGATLSAFSLHRLVQPPGPPPMQISLRSYWGAKENDTAPCATRNGGTCNTFTRAHYSLIREEAVVLDRREDTDPATKYLDLVYSVGAADNGLSDFVGTKLNPTFSPDGYVDEGSQDRMVVYVEGGQGRVELQSYYSSSRKDYWVIASQASRAEAISRGYVLAGHLGYALKPPLQDSTSTTMVHR